MALVGASQTAHLKRIKVYWKNSFLLKIWFEAQPTEYRFLLKIWFGSNILLIVLDFSWVWLTNLRTIFRRLVFHDLKYVIYKSSHSNIIEYGRRFIQNDYTDFWLTPSRPLRQTCFTYPKLNMDGFSVLAGPLWYGDSTK